MDRKRKKKKTGKMSVKQEFLIVLTVAAIIGLLSFQTIEKSSLFKPLEVPQGYVSWEVFATTKEVEVCTKDEDLFENCEVKPEYGKEILQHDNQEVKLMGYMFPLMQGENQKEFLLGPYPQSCPFHYHIGPAQVVEVHSPKGIKFSYEPVKVEGKFIAEYNPELGVFYYLKDAKITE